MFYFRLRHQSSFDTRFQFRKRTLTLDFDISHQASSDIQSLINDRQGKQIRPNVSHRRGGASTGAAADRMERQSRQEKPRGVRYRGNSTLDSTIEHGEIWA